MTWLAPALALTIAGIAIPSLVILYFLKLRRREVEVSSTLLWRRAVQDLQANAPFQKLRRNILLVLQLLALAAAIMAVAQPQRRAGAGDATRHVILIDRSASMKAIDGDPSQPGSAMSRLDAAKKAAKDTVDSLREPTLFSRDAADLAMVIAFDADAEVRRQFTTDKALLKAAIDAIEPTDGPSRLASAVRLATAHSTTTIVENRGLIAGPGATLHLFSDGRITDAADISLGRNDSVIFHPSGTPDAGNIGITALRVERGYEDPERVSVFVGVHSTLSRPREIDVELTVGDAVVGVKRIALVGALRPAPEARREPVSTGVVFEFTRAEPTLALVRLIDPLSPTPRTATVDADVLPADDNGRLVIPPSRRNSVLLVTRGSLFLPSLLEVLPLAGATTVTPEAFEAMVTDGRASKFDVVVLDGWVPEKAMPAGRYLIFNAVPSGVGLAQSGTSEGVRVIDWSRSHPTLRDVNLDAVDIGKARVLSVTPPTDGSGALVTTLASATQGPMILETINDDWRSIIVPFDVAESDWVFDHGLLVFVSQSIAYLGGTDAGAVSAASSLRPGDLLSDRLPLAATDVRIRTDAGGEFPIVPSSDGRIAFGPIQQSGIYSVSWVGPMAMGDAASEGRSVRVFAANLLDAAESDVAPVSTLALASQDAAAAPAVSSPAFASFWPWLAGIALAIVLMEWWVYNRLVHL